MRRPGSDARQGGKNSPRIRGSAFRLPGAAKTASHAPPAPGATADPSVSPVLIDSGMIQFLRGLAADHVEVVSNSRQEPKACPA
jgi:hypothetical protein